MIKPETHFPYEQKISFKVNTSSGKLVSSLPHTNLLKQIQEDKVEFKSKNSNIASSTSIKNTVTDFSSALKNINTSARQFVSFCAESAITSLKKTTDFKTRNEQLASELLKDLSSEDKDKKITAITLLGKLKDETAISTMLDMLNKNHLSSEVGTELIHALAATKNRNIVQSIINVLIDTNRDEKLRMAAAITLGQLKDSKAAKPLFSTLRNDESPSVRSSAAAALSSFPSIRNAEQLVKSLKDPSELVRASAVMSLGIIGTKDAVPDITRLLQDSNSAVKSNAALTLGNLKAESALDDLVKALNETNSNVIISIARAINFIDADKGVQKLVEALNSTNPIIMRRGAAACLQIIQNNKSINSLNTIVADKNEDIMLRKFALLALINMKSTECLNNLSSMIKDPNEDFKLKVVAGAGIGTLGNESHIDNLLNAANETEIAELKNNCINGVRNIIAKSEKKITFDFSKLLSLLEDDNQNIRAMVVDILGYLKSEDKVDKLIDLASKEERIVRAYAISALGRIADKKAEPLLLNILKNDPDHIICSSAAKALYSMGSKDKLYDVINSPTEKHNVKTHAAGVLIVMGEKSPILETFLKPGLNIRKLHEQDIKGQGIETAVIDSNIDPKHPEFDNRLILETLEYHHGNMVAGNLGGNISGVAPRTVIHCYDAYENKSVDRVLEKIVDQKINGDNDIKVVNISLGFNPRLMSDPEVFNVVRKFDHIAQIAKKLGITVVVAAGNDGRDVPLPQIGTLNPLCLSENVISVGATKLNGTSDDSSDDTRADFSSYPGADSPRQLDVMAPGLGITLPYIGGSYKTVDGASYSSSFVSGLVALMYQVNPNIKPDEVREILKDTAIKLKGVLKNMQGSGEVDPLMAVVSALKLADPIQARKLSEKLGLSTQLTIDFYNQPGTSTKKSLVEG